MSTPFMKDKLISPLLVPLRTKGRWLLRWTLFVSACLFALSSSCRAQISYLYDWVPQPYSNKVPVEYGYVEQANGHLHLEIPIGETQHNRGGSGATNVRLVYDSNFWYPDTFGTSSYTWYPGAAWHLLPSPTSYGYMGYPDSLVASATDTNGVQYHFPCQAGCYSTEGHGVWIDSSDGSTSGVYGPDGSNIVNFWQAEDSNGSTSVDANGNYVSIGYKDSPSVNGQLSGLAYFSASNIPFLYTYTQSTYLPNGSLGPINEIYTVPNMNSAGGTETYTAQEVPIQLVTSFNSERVAVAQCGSMSDGVCTTQVISSIVLPDATSFTFKYDCDSSIAAQQSYCSSPGGQSTYYGGLTQMTTPTGAVYKYSYRTFTDDYGDASLTLASRYDGYGTWQYSQSATPLSCPQFNSVGCTQTMTTVEPNGRTMVTTNTMNNGAWPTSVLVTDGAGHNLSLTTTQWDFSHPDLWLGYAAAYVHKLSETQTLWDSTGAAETSKTAYTYDSPQTGNITVLQQWGYYPGTSPSFPSVPDITTKTLYYAPTNSPIASQAPYPPKGGTNVIDKPSSITVYNGAGSMVAQKLISYDQYAPSQITGVVNHDDQSYGSNQLVRGNPTSVSQWVSGSQYVTTQMTYDTTGQVVSSTDGNGNVTKYDYTDAYYVDNGTSSPSAYAPPTPTHAYATTVTLPKVNGRTFTTKAGYYYGDQQTAFTTDINNNSTYFHYADPLDRLTQTVYPLGWTLTQYTSPTQTDVYKSLTTSSPSSGCTGCLHSSTIYDGLQRVIRTIGVDGSIVDIAYNPMGLVQSVSNPYQTLSDSTYGLTTYAYDVLGRLCMQNNPDSNNSQTTSCTAKGSSAQQFTYIVNGGFKTDENGNTWEYLYDPLGRLASVSEPNGATTQYTNDVLGNLLSVTQTGLSTDGEIPRLRSFTYDGLSRLVTATNPESGKVCYGSGSSCTGGYDGDGNVITKTDARGVTTSYSYDALNRLISKTYTGVTGSVAATQPSTYIYDQTTSGGIVPNANGRLVEEYTGSSSTPTTERFILGYDAMGRITQEQQCAVISICGVAPYSFQYMYDLAGDVTYSTNGVSSTGIGITYAYDNAKRLQTITSTWDDATHPPALFSPPATGAQYSSVGLISASLGSVNPSQQPAFTLQRVYDNRLRPISETDVATASVLNPATLSSGSITIGGIEQQASGPGTPATGQIQITGQEGSHQVCTTGPAPVGGKGITRCNTVADTGSLSVSVDGFVATASYGAISSDATLATALATALSASGSPVTATSSNNVITMTSVATGTTADYPYSVSNGADFSGTDSGAALTGGVSGAIIYDSGSVSVTVNGSTVTVPWQEGSSAQTIASGLLSALQSADGSFLTVNLSGTTLSLTSKQTGTAADWTIATSVVYDSAAFTSASFSAAASGMTGGSDATDGPTTIYSYSIPTGGYAPNGNLLNLNDSVTGGWTYTYDSLNRLTKAQAGANAQTGVAPYGSGLLSWTYDSFGNYEGEALSGNTTISLPQVTHTYTGHSLLNGVAQNGVITNQMDGYNYDASGNLLSDNISSTYSYDAEGRVAAVDGTTQYVYDAEGRRVAKLNGTTATNIYLLGLAGEQVSEVNNSTGVMAWAHSNVYANGGLLATYSPSGLHFHFADWLGTRRVQSLVQTAGSEVIEETCLSLPYGDALTCSGTDATEQHFTGKERDTESGLDYFGARYYASSMGHFMNPDWGKGPVPYATLGNPQSLNLYAYVGNSPLVHVDVTGHSFASGLPSQDGPQDDEQADEAQYEDMVAASSSQAQQQSQQSNPPASPPANVSQPSSGKPSGTDLVVGAAIAGAVGGKLAPGSNAAQQAAKAATRGVRADAPPTTQVTDPLPAPPVRPNLNKLSPSNDNKTLVEALGQLLQGFTNFTEKLVIPPMYIKPSFRDQWRELNKGPA